MLHHRQLLLLLRAQQSAGRKRVRYLRDTKPVYHSKEIEELIDRFDLELPQTEEFFVTVPVKASVEPLEPSEELSPKQTTKILQQSLVGVIKELTTLLATLDKEDEVQREKQVAVQTILENAKKVTKKIRQEEELLLILME
jgi:hypothetical protein